MSSTSQITKRFVKLGNKVQNKRQSSILTYWKRRKSQRYDNPTICRDCFSCSVVNRLHTAVHIWPFYRATWKSIGHSGGRDRRSLCQLGPHSFVFVADSTTKNPHTLQFSFNMAPKIFQQPPWGELNALCSGRLSCLMFQLLECCASSCWHIATCLRDFQGSV